MRISFLLALTPILVAGGFTPRSGASCPVRGVWELESMTVDGQSINRPGFRQRKMVTDRHFMWIGQFAGRDTIVARTAADTLRMYFISGGSGRYNTTPTTYVEHIDLENDPSWLGTSFTATCRVENGKWYHGFTVPNDTTKGQFRRFMEVWRRVE